MTPAARPAPVSRPDPRVSPPLVRLGVLWTLVLVVGLAEGTLATAIILAVVSGVAAGSLCRRLGDPISPPPMIAAAAVPLLAVAGPVVAVIALIAAGALGAALTFSGRSRLPALRGVLVIVAPSAAAASLVLARRQGLGAAVALAAAVCLWDAANYLMGTGEHGGILGAIAGAVTLAVLAVLLAAVFSPPLTGIRPYVVVALIAVLAALGPLVARWLSGGARVPALARLDSLLLAGPAWVLAIAVLSTH